MDVDDSIGDHNDISVEVNGHTYQAQANLDLDDDGVVDAVGLQTDDGTTVYADTDHDGRADRYYELDDHANVVRTATFADGHWTDGGAGESPHEVEPAASDLYLDTGHGEIDAGQATVDSDGDGRPDTAIADDGHGGKVLYTDTNGDGKADVATRMSADDTVSISRDVGHGRWSSEEHGHIDEHGEYRRDDGPDAGADEVWGVRSGGEANVVRIDARTGQWISPN